MTDQPKIKPEDSWIDPLNDQPASPGDIPEKNFNDQILIRRAQREFWNLAIEDIRSGRTPAKKTILKDGNCDFLISYVSWALAQESRERPPDLLLRRLENNFDNMSGSKFEAVAMQIFFYGLYLENRPADRIAIISVLFKLNLQVAKAVEEKTRPRGFKRLRETLAGRNPVLITYNEQADRPVLNITESDDRKLLSGPAGSVLGRALVKKSDIPTATPIGPRYPGETFDPALLAVIVDQLVASEFDLESIIKRAIFSDDQSSLALVLADIETDENSPPATSNAPVKVCETLGQIYCAVSFMANGKDSPYLKSTAAEIKRVLKPLRQPERLADVSLNIFGNSLIAAVDANRALRPAIIIGMTQLAAANGRLFSELAFDYFAIGAKFKKPAFAAPEAGKSAAATETARQAPATATTEAKEAWEENLPELAPFDRLVAIWQSGKIDLERTARFDNYAREALSLILCGKRLPDAVELDHGYNKWQQLVHTDKKPDAVIAQFSNFITDIGDLARRKEFIRESAKATLVKLFDLIAEVFASHSLLIVPRQARRLLVIGENYLDDVLQRSGYGNANIQVIIEGRLIPPETFGETQVSAGQIIEVILIK